MNSEKNMLETYQGLKGLIELGYIMLINDAEGQHFELNANIVLALLNDEIPLPRTLYRNLKKDFSGEDLKCNLSAMLSFYYKEYHKKRRKVSSLNQEISTEKDVPLKHYGIIYNYYDLDNPSMDGTGRYCWFSPKQDIIEKFESLAREQNSLDYVI